MKQDDVEQVVITHLKSLPQTTSSKIGSKYLRYLYMIFLSTPKIHKTLVADDKGKVIGVISATKDLKSTEKIIRKKLFPTILLFMTKAILTKRLSPTELIKRIYHEKKLMNIYKKPYLSVLTLFVKREFRKQGVGKKLLDQLLKDTKGSINTYVDTLIQNKNAIKFYKANKFRQIDKLNDSFILVR